MNAIQWTEAEMIFETIAWWEDDQIEAQDCCVIEGRRDDDHPCLIVLHKPTGRTSDEAGNNGRWNLDGSAVV